jgi:hypothetical protein
MLNTVICLTFLIPHAPLHTKRDKVSLHCSKANLIDIELQRFPPESVTVSNRRLASERLEWLRHRRDLLGGREIQEAIRDQEYRYRCWDELRDAIRSVPTNPDDDLGRMHALNSLRILIGEHNYLFGKMPEPVDWGGFRRID